MKSAALILTGAVLFLSCKPRDPAVGAGTERESVAVEASHQLATDFPLLPVIEEKLWSQLLTAEAALAAAPASGREAVNREVDRLTAILRSRHPFKVGAERLELGGIVYDRARQKFSLTAKVAYPDPGDERHPGEVELLLCTEAGRLHETLFVTDARPLHLELLMHLAGHAKGPQGGRFRIEVLMEDGTRLPVDSLVRTTDGELLQSPLLWEFSGSDYQDLYAPDLSGDLAIFWHAHDSVLRVAHEGIASGVVKLEPVLHPALKNGTPVTLELIPFAQSHDGS